MKVLFWAAFFGVLYTYVGYPVLIWAWARLRPRPWGAAPITPSVDIVLAVHNGMAHLPGKIKQLLALDYPKIQEIIVVSDGSTDGTAELLSNTHHQKFRAIVLEKHMGKAVAINAGVAAATADMVLFLDVRPEVAPGAVLQLMGNFADPTVGCAAGELVLRKEGDDVTSQAVSGLYWKYEQWTRRCEAAVDSPVGVSGCFYAARRNCIVPLPPGTILDDMYQPLSIVRQGLRSVLDTKAIVYDTCPENASGEFHRKVRTLAGNFQLFDLAPWLLTLQDRLLFQLVSHKVLRLVAPYLMLLMLFSSMVMSPRSIFFATIAWAQVAIAALAVVGLCFKVPFLHRIIAPASAFLMLNIAAVVGLYKYLFTRGPLWMIWNVNPPRPMARASSASGQAP